MDFVCVKVDRLQVILETSLMDTVCPNKSIVSVHVIGHLWVRAVDMLEDGNHFCFVGAFLPNLQHSDDFRCRDVYHL